MIFQKVDRELWIITAAKKRLVPNAQEAADVFSTASSNPSTANANIDSPNIDSSSRDNAGFRFGGLLATWVIQSSLDPARPVVMISISKNHYTYDLIKDSNAFAIHLITPNWLATAWKFATTSGHHHDKLAGLKLALGESGSPILTEALAWADCSVFHQLDLGDRMLFWGDILDSKISSQEAPLREQAFFASATPEQLKQLKESMSHEIESSGPLSESWRKSLKG